jgi:hypothetical protein
MRPDEDLLVRISSQVNAEAIAIEAGTASGGHWLRDVTRDCNSKLEPTAITEHRAGLA